VPSAPAGNGQSFYAHEMSASSAEKLVLETHLRHAVQRSELFLNYQPILNGSTGRTSGVEALLRWRHPQRGSHSAGPLHSAG
jgi:EAL domain-containing protein (putative c-di-GMP-specific phosphodiesterase class I)